MASKGRQRVKDLLDSADGHIRKTQDIYAELGKMFQGNEERYYQAFCDMMVCLDELERFNTTVRNEI